MGVKFPLKISSIGLLAILAGGAGDTPLAVVVQTQEGFAGKTGTRTTLAEDGSYVVQQLVDGTIVATLRTGQLSAPELAKARAAIQAARLAEQPRSVGAPPPVNAREISIEAAGVKRDAVGPPGTPGASAAMQGPVPELARSLDELTIR